MVGKIAETPMTIRLNMFVARAALQSKRPKNL